VLLKGKFIGFKYITIDLQGFRSGAMNESLLDKERQKHNKE
jgi:PP-loop superfamily ATP-utilizing enzyme